MCVFWSPSAAATARKHLTLLEGWQFFRICPVRNAHHGCLIETDHEVLLFILADLSDRFAFSDKIALDPDREPTMLLWLQDLSIILPSPILMQRDDPYKT